MAELKCGFYNAVMVDGIPDRTYNADEINDFLEGLVSRNGVFATVSTACQVTSGTGMQVVVKAGKGMVNNHWFKIDSDITLDIEAADVILNRIDSVVVKHSNVDRKITLEIKKGELATSPVASLLTRNEEVYEICLAKILVSKNITAINNSMITDTRSNNEVCGWITGLINQIDTTTLFNQYETAQNNFIEEQTTEYINWEAGQQANFDTWFNGIKDEVKATNLYREYQAIYNTNISGQSVITIPSSINYVHNGLDVLNVYINGMRLLKDVEYTINSNGTQISLTVPLDVANTDVEFVNKKSIEGTAAESVVVQVENLQEDVDNLSTNIYLATGENDNVKLSNMVKNFLNATEDYSNVSDNASMKINVSGTLTIDSLIDNQMMFDFHGSVASNRKIIIDFANSTIPVMPRVDTKINLLAVFGCEGNVEVHNANVKVENYNATTIYGFHGGVAKNCNLNIDNSTATTIYGSWAGEEVSNSKIKINGAGTVYGVYAVEKCYFNTLTTSSSTTEYAIYSSNGIYVGNTGEGSSKYTGSTSNYIANSGFTNK